MKAKIGWVLTVLPSLLLLFSAYGKLFNAVTEDVMKGMEHVGIDMKLLQPLGILEAAVTILYLIPKTSFIGAILITGYMGGAILTHLRVGDPFFIQMIIPIVVWIGLGLRRPEIGALVCKSKS